MVRRGKNFRTPGKNKGFEASQDQILGKSTYAYLQDQALHDEQILYLCQRALVNAWGRIQELRKRIEYILGLKKAKENPLVTFYKD